MSELRDDDAAARFYLGLVLMRQRKVARCRRASSAGGDPARSGRRGVPQPRLRARAARPVRRSAVGARRGVRAAAARRTRASRTAGRRALLRMGDPLPGGGDPDDRAPSLGHPPPDAGVVSLRRARRSSRPAISRARRVPAHGGRSRPTPDAAPLHNLARGAERRADHADALEAAERGRVEDAGIAQLHKNIGDCHYRAARYDDALEGYPARREAQPAARRRRVPQARQHPLQAAGAR